MNQPGAPQPPLPQAALTALQQGRKIEAIKLVREVEGLGLKEAKDRVEAFEASDPMLRERSSAGSSGDRKGCLWGVVLIALGVLAFFLWRMRS